MTMSNHASEQFALRFGQNLKRARESAGWTQRKLAILMDVDNQAVSRWERGAVHPGKDNVVRLGDLFGHDPGWFYADHVAADAAVA